MKLGNEAFASVIIDNSWYDAVLLALAVFF